MSPIDWIGLWAQLQVIGMVVGVIVAIPILLWIAIDVIRAYRRGGK